MKTLQQLATVRSHSGFCATRGHLAILMTVWLGTVMISENARGAFHFWAVNEVYSSADGSVQFIELRALSGGQQNLGTFGATIRSTNALGTSSFTCPSNLPGDSANKTCILGTTNLVLIPGGLTPDYFIPPNFVRSPVAGSSAAVIFVPNSGTAISYASLPTDGLTAVTSGGVATNTPKNFGNQSNTIVPVAIQSAVLDEASIVLAFRTATGVNGSAGPDYTVEYKDSATNTTWNSLPAVGGNGTTRAVTNTTTESDARIYRLRVP